MGFAEFVRSMFSREEAGYSAIVSSEGIVFDSPLHDLCKQGKATGKIQSQFIFLQMMKEQQEIEEDSLFDGFFIPSERACALSEGERELLELPGPWPGEFELFTHGRTSKVGGFRPELRLVCQDGRKTSDWKLEGPYLIADGEKFLPSSAQYLALAGVARHSSISLDMQTEGDNLAAVYALQRAQRAGESIDLHHFNEIHIEEPEGVGISIIEEPDGSLRLVPEFGLQDISPEQVEARIHQLQGRNASCVRVGKKLVMLDEKKLRGIQEILNKRTIPASDRESFLKAPSAFLDAYLVDLDNGFSLRVYGEEVFRKAYFGENDARHSDWFGEDGQGIFVLLENAAPLLQDEQEFFEFCSEVRQAFEDGSLSIQFGETTVLLPSDKGRLEEGLEKVQGDLHRYTPPSSSSTAGWSEKPEAITVGIELNDDTLFGTDQKESQESCYYWKDELDNSPMSFTPFDYQKEGIRWLVGHAMHALNAGRNSFEGALLADDMGLGKTFMTLAGIDAWQNIQRAEKEDYVAKPILVVSPVVLLENWKDEVDKFFPKSPFSEVVMLQSSADLKKFRVPEVVEDRIGAPALKVAREYGSSRLGLPGSLILTNYETLRRYPFSLASIDWGMAIFDEAQAIKNPNAQCSRAAKGLKADFRLAVTGTPVENSLIDFWNIFDTVNPGMLGTYQDFRHRYIKPVLDAEDRDEIRRTKGAELRAVVDHFMLRRTKEDKLDKAIPSKRVLTGGQEAGQISWLAPVMSGYQRDSYDEVIKKVSAARAGGRLMEVLLPSLMALRNISLHPALGKKDGIHLPQNIREAEEFIKESAKLQAMMKALQEIRTRGEKVIIFVINRTLQGMLATSLAQIFKLDTVSVINGETKAVSTKKDGSETRKSLIKEFESKPGFGIIIMSPLAAGVGITVTGANNVIHLERHWNPAKEAQASDRVYRIGQKKDVNIYIPILEHPEKISFDRNLDQLLQHKIDLKDAVVTPGDIKAEDFDMENLLGG